MSIGMARAPGDMCSVPCAAPGGPTDEEGGREAALLWQRDSIGDLFRVTHLCRCDYQVPFGHPFLLLVHVRLISPLALR